MIFKFFLPFKYQSFIILAAFRRSVFRASPRLRAWATQLRRNIAAVLSIGNTAFDLTPSPSNEPMTSRADGDISNHPIGLSTLQITTTHHVNINEVKKFNSVQNIRCSMTSYAKVKGDTQAHHLVQTSVSC